MFKQEKGITLVALVITIIVLLILAGVSISLVVGDNGVLSQANKSKSETQTAQAKEALTSAIAGCQGDFTTTVYVNNSAASFSDYMTASKLNAELKKAGYKVITSSTDYTEATDTSVSDLYASAGFYIATADATTGSTVYAVVLTKTTGSYNVTLTSFTAK